MWNNTIGRLYKVYCYRNMMLFVYHIKGKETLDITEGKIKNGQSINTCKIVRKTHIDYKQSKKHKTEN